MAPADPYDILSRVEACLHLLQQQGISYIEPPNPKVASVAPAAVPAGSPGNLSHQSAQPSSPGPPASVSRPYPSASAPPAAVREDKGMQMDLMDQGTLPPPPDDRAGALHDVAKQVSACTRCKLHPHRTHTVPGEGNPAAELMFVGEGPGRNEDLQGRPFVGRAGNLLDQMIEAMGYGREEVFIGNVVKCRPPGNRDPEPDEIEQCEPYLKRQLEIIQPKIIVGLGRVAVQTLLKTKTPISRLRGKWHKYHHIDFMPTFHPAYLLRNPAEKRACWEDLQAVMARLGRSKSD